MKKTNTKAITRTYIAPSLITTSIITLVYVFGTVGIFDIVGHNIIRNTDKAEAIETIYNARALGTPIEIHINDNGKTIIQGARIEQFAGSTIFARVYWGTAFLRVTIRTNPQTIFEKKFGGEIKITDMKVGDFVSIDGDFFGGTSSLDITAKKIRNWSDQTIVNEYKGDIISMGTTTRTFLMKVTYSPATSTILNNVINVNYTDETTVERGNLRVDASTIKPGDKVISAYGPFDYGKNTLSTKFIKLYQNMGLFSPQNHVGTMKSVADDGKSIVITVSGKDYTVLIDDKTEILRNSRVKTIIKRFVPGDGVRVFGSIQENDQSSIKAEIIRNTNL